MKKNDEHCSREIIAYEKTVPQLEDNARLHTPFGDDGIQDVEPLRYTYPNAMITVTSPAR
ncbi:MAG: hypothetical protein ACXV5H_01135 [Halobacteriota archaeon]